MKELEGEGVPILLSKDILDRCMAARLFQDGVQLPPGESTPCNYLLKCYANASDELRALLSKGGKNENQERLYTTLQEIKNLVLSYFGLLFSEGVIPQVCLVPLDLRMIH